MWPVAAILDSAILDLPFGLPKLSPLLLQNTLAVFKLFQKCKPSLSSTTLSSKQKTLWLSEFSLQIKGDYEQQINEWVKSLVVAVTQNQGLSCLDIGLPRRLVPHSSLLQSSLCPLISDLFGLQVQCRCTCSFPLSTTPSLSYPLLLSPWQITLRLMVTANPLLLPFSTQGPCCREQQKLPKDSSNRQWGSGEGRVSKSRENPLLSLGGGVGRRKRTQRLGIELEPVEDSG